MFNNVSHSNHKPLAICRDEICEETFRPMSFEIDVSCQCKTQSVDLKLIQAAIEHGLRIEGVESAVLSVSVVDNATIHELNRQHLNHDYPTDVISFQLDWFSLNETADEGDWGEDEGDSDDAAITETSNTAPFAEAKPAAVSGRSAGCGIEGEIIVSAEYAAESAATVGWTMQDELTLYAVHGMLHICGYDDLTPDEKFIMRARQRAVLEGLGLTPQHPADEPTSDSSDDAVINVSNVSEAGQ